jgi:hypothetical protein
MKVKTYTVVSRAIEEGIARGYRRARKHTDNPEPEAIKESIYNEVMNALCDVIEFFDEEVDLSREADGEES